MKESRSVWTPTPLEMLELGFLTLIDKHNPPYEILYLYGPTQEGGEVVENMITSAKNMYFGGITKRVGILGTTFKEGQERGITWMGVEFWQQIIDRDPAIPPKDTVRLPACYFTAEESEQLLRLTDQNKWERLCIMAVPQHLPRCVLNVVATMKKLGIDKNIYAVAASLNHDWSKMATKTVVGGEKIIGHLVDHIPPEYERIVKCGGKVTPGGMYLPPFPPCATVAELKEYLKKRNARDR